MKQYTVKNPDIFNPKMEPDLWDSLMQELKGSVVELCDRAIADVTRRVENGELLCCRCGEPAPNGKLKTDVVGEGWDAKIQFTVICKECESKSAAD